MMCITGFTLLLTLVPAADAIAGRDVDDVVTIYVDARLGSDDIDIEKGE